jgi:histidinol-phosphate/aromatic aminotransferase/cobyric acid decarboxylase-like protein
MADIKDKIVPWVWTAPEYNTGILDKAWAQPECGRMMLNENPVPPSDAVVEAITDMAKKGNRYPIACARSWVSSTASRRRTSPSPTARQRPSTR